MKNLTLAVTFRTLAAEGKAGFYTGRIASEIIKVVQDRGGLIEIDDLCNHMDNGSEFSDPISRKFYDQGLPGQSHGIGGVELWEHPSNGARKAGQDSNLCTRRFQLGALSAIIEALRLAFVDGQWFVTDPTFEQVPIHSLISEAYLSERAKLFGSDKAATAVENGNPQPSSPSPALQSNDTVYFAMTDCHGNTVSFINSNYSGFGTGIIPRGCGFTLQNRGANFSLDSWYPNRLAPRKRPDHTIIPGMVTNTVDNSLFAALGVMGGFMQPQGHVQVLLGQIVGRLDPQQALDAPRICIHLGLDGWIVQVEEGMPAETIEGLEQLGYKVVVIRGNERSIFGRSQVIRYTVDAVEGTPIWSAGSDVRGDGAAYPAQSWLGGTVRGVTLDLVMYTNTNYASVKGAAMVHSGDCTKACYPG